MTTDRYEIDNEIYITHLLTNDDIPSFVKYLNNQTIHDNTLTIPYPYTEHDGETFVNSINSEKTESERLFTIRLNENNELIGTCGIHRSVQNERLAEIGYWLGEPYWHKGLMSKVVKKVIEITKTEWNNLVRIEANIFHWNIASMRVVEKCGFQFEGILRKRVFKDGKDIDLHSYSLIFE